MENLLSACLWQDGHSRVDPYLIHPHPLPQDYGYAIIAQFFFSFFFFFFFFFAYLFLMLLWFFYKWPARFYELMRLNHEMFNQIY